MEGQKTIRLTRKLSPTEFTRAGMVTESQKVVTVTVIAVEA